MAEENNITTPAFNELISEEDINSAKVSGLQTRPNAPTSYGGNGLSAAELQEHFDKLAMLAIHKINAIIAAINTSEFSKNLPLDSLTFKTLDSLVGGIVSGALANAIKVDSNDSGESDNGYDATLQAVLTTLLTKAKSLETDIGNGDLAKAIKVTYVSEVGDGDDDETTEGEFSPLQAVLTYLTNYVSALNTAKGNGQLAMDIYVGKATINDTDVEFLASYLSQLKFYVNTLEANLNDGDILNRIIAKNHGTASQKNLSQVLTDLETDIAQVEINANKAYRYMGSTRFEDLENNAGNLREGDVWNISNSFELDDKTYPAGTNVAWNATGGKWDPLGGYIDYGSLAAEIEVTPYSGKTLLQAVLDILSTPWDLIITSPADLGNLSTASGNVLVRLEGEDNVIGTNDAAAPYFKLGSGIRLLDLGGSTFASAHIEAVKSAETTIRNGKIAYGFLNNFRRVDNCKGIISTSSCTFVTNCVLRQVYACDYVVNCSTYPEDPGDVSFWECNLISNLKVNSLEDGQGMPSGTVEFKNCHHISNVHCAEGAENAVNIHYENCTYVDPYTCAGYVQTEDIGKVPVPTEKGGVEFKEFVPIIPNTSAYSQVYSQLPNGDPSRIAASPSSTNKGLIPLRQADGHIEAPDQTVSPPSDNQYIAKKYADGHYVPIIKNDSESACVYGRLKSNGNHKLIPYGSIKSGALAMRSDNGQIKAPNQVDHEPDLDHFISRRYFEANPPSGGGGKLYRHLVEFSKSYNEGSDDSACHGQVVLYKTNATEITSLSQINGMAVSGASGQLWDFTDGIFAVISQANISDNKFYIWGFTTTQLANFTNETQMDYGAWTNSDLTITDTVTEV